MKNFSLVVFCLSLQFSSAQTGLFELSVAPDFESPFRAVVCDSAGNILKILEPNYIALGLLSSAPGGTFTNSMYNSQLNAKDYSYYLAFTNNTNVEWTINKEFKLQPAFQQMQK